MEGKPALVPSARHASLREVVADYRLNEFPRRLSRFYYLTLVLDLQYCKNGTLSETMLFGCLGAPDLIREQGPLKEVVYVFAHRGRKDITLTVEIDEGCANLMLYGELAGCKGKGYVPYKAITEAVPKGGADTTEVQQPRSGLGGDEAEGDAGAADK